ncbi:c-type cytochrome [Altererythrobacter sp. MF3-039]|uniref:c-type cytochrome n=1 Tax=Altererythrobacter sp. MF3-039 TaxID=3252901 RepID=UPI00390C8C80
MTKRFLASVAAVSTLLAACSTGESEPAETGETAAAPAEPTDTADSGADLDPMATKDGIAYASLTGDAAAGKIVFAQCRSCHVTDPNINRTGPSLAGIIGAPAGVVQGYNYTPANANSGIVWTEEQMYVYLEDPRRTIPGTKMAFAGLKDAQKRADVIAYLKDPS